MSSLKISTPRCHAHLRRLRLYNLTTGFTVVTMATVAVHPQMQGHRLKSSNKSPSQSVKSGQSQKLVFGKNCKLSTFSCSSLI